MPGPTKLLPTISRSTVVALSRFQPIPTTGCAISHRSRFLKACAGQRLSHPPVWMMRQAGRALPEYRQLKEHHTFLELVRTPELAAEVTLQPIRRFDMDAAILFSDILVIPEAMGQGYFFRDTGGIEMDFQIRTRADIERLQPEAVTERLQYVVEAIRLIKPELHGRTAFLGFAGSPWTLANFMLEGGSAREPKASLEMLRREPETYQLLASKLTQAITEFLLMQIDAGVDAVQIFDSHGGLLPGPLFHAGSGLWMQRIIQGLGHRVPVIVFSKGARAWRTLAGLGAEVLGVDHGIQMEAAIQEIPADVAVQGNLDPSLLVTGDEELVRRETNRLLDCMADRPGWIFNLGHGLPPAAQLENIHTVIDTIRAR